MWAKMNQLDALARIISPKKLGNSKFLDLRLKKASLSKDSKIFAKCNIISWHRYNFNAEILQFLKHAQALMAFGEILFCNQITLKCQYIRAAVQHKRYHRV